MKRIAVMQPYFFPYLGYWQLIGAVDIYVVFDDVNYIKRGWINRNRIRLANGDTSFIRIPISKVSQNKLICEHSILGIDETKATLLKTIEYNYKKRPHYDEGLKLVEEIFSLKSSNLADFLYNQIKIVSSYFGFNTKIIRSSELNNKKDLSGQEKIIDIVKLLEGDVYINAIGGRELYDSNKFLEENIHLLFLNPWLPPYEQGFSDFVPALSVLDIVMNCSRYEVISLGNHHELISI